MNSILTDTVPVVMSFSAHDPSGSSGIQADIETLGALQCHCAPIVTTLTTKDTVKVAGSFPCPETLVINQARMVLEDAAVCAFKIGMLGSESNAAAVHTLLQDYAHIPVIVDATLITYDVEHYESGRLLEALRQMVIPSAHILVVNPRGAQYLAGNSDALDACAHQLMELGAEHVLLTRANHNGGRVANRFFGNFRLLETLACHHAAQEYQGEGSTLTAAVAGFVAQGVRPVAAVHQALEYTEHCIKRGFRAGMGSPIPNRLYASRHNICAYDASDE